jgi:hypothetical protein
MRDNESMQNLSRPKHQIVRNLQTLKRVKFNDPEGPEKSNNTELIMYAV